jgi:hypothetical protein
MAEEKLTGKGEATKVMHTTWFDPGASRFSIRHRRTAPASGVWLFAAQPLRPRLASGGSPDQQKLEYRRDDI